MSRLRATRRRLDEMLAALGPLEAKHADTNANARRAASETIEKLAQRAEQLRAERVAYPGPTVTNHFHHGWSLVDLVAFRMGAYERAELPDYLEQATERRLETMGHSYPETVAMTRALLAWAEGVRLEARRLLLEQKGGPNAT